MFHSPQIDIIILSLPDELREGIFEKRFEVAEIAKFSPEEAEEYEDSLKVYRDLKIQLIRLRRRQ